MERPELTLVTETPEAKRSLVAAAMATSLLIAAGLATWAGAGDARRRFSPAALAESALTSTLAGDDPGAVDRALQDLRVRLVSVPLDAATRTTLANLQVEAASDAAGQAAAADQATTATRLVRSDEWVARAAARVLSRCGRGEQALDQVASIFRYAPAQAALALSEIEPFVGDVERGIPELPAAWTAWAVRLREMGREPESDARLAALLARWPTDIPALVLAAGIASGRDDVKELSRLVPATIDLPATRAAGPLFAYRARSKAEAGDANGARRDIATALELCPGDPWVWVRAGDASLAFDPRAARDYWTRALYELEARGTPRTAAAWVHLRLARLDDREGKGASALRNWRSILAARPDSAEARRRIAELTGGSPP